MELAAIVGDAWGWTGIRPARVIAGNDFGNLIVQDDLGRYWRLCPEDLYCRLIANSKSELDQLWQDQEFLEDWHMTGLVEKARQQFGPLQSGRCYCLKIPSAIGGEYGGSNLATISLSELVSVSGDIAQQIQGLPDGAKIELNIVE